jgi:hypothetical protein
MTIILIWAALCLFVLRFMQVVQRKNEEQDAIYQAWLKAHR